MPFAKLVELKMFQSIRGYYNMWRMKNPNDCRSSSGNVKMKSRKSLKLNYWKWSSSNCNCNINALKLAYVVGHILAHITSSKNQNFVVPLYIHGLSNLLDLMFSLWTYSWELVFTARITVNFRLKNAICSLICSWNSVESCNF